MRSSTRRLAAVLATGVLVVPTTAASAAVTGGATPDRVAGHAESAAVAVPAIKWGSCGSDAKLAAFQCASVEVPTDYDHPRGPTTTIALTRLPAGDPAQRIGTLFTNPGGPGGSGVSFVQTAAAVAYSPEVRARFDILGFDPRGVGGSDPATCYPTAAEETAALAGVPIFPVTRAEEIQYTAAMAKVGASCAKTSRDRFAHYSTANVARDMDLLRQAVGDSKLSYAGYSYGTYLGATYAALFPSKVRALVLDGTWQPEAYAGTNGDSRPFGVRVGQGEAASEVLAQFAAECKKAGCALTGLGDPAAVVEKTFQRLKISPVELMLGDGSKLTVTYAVAVQMVFSSLYTPAEWPNLAGLLATLATAPEPRAAGARRTATVAAGKLPASLLESTRRREDYGSIGTYLQPCVEARRTGRPLAYPAYADQAEMRAPHFGRFRVWISQNCEFLPVRDSDAFVGPWKLKVKSPVLVFGTRHDPATPYKMTRPYSDLYPDARMVTVNGWGHTTIGKSACADAAITKYLVSLQAPTDGSTCDQNRRPFDPPS